MLVNGTIAPLWGLIIAFAAIYIGMYLGNKGHKFECRPIAAFDALEEAVGRATELGKPVLVVPGRGDLSDSRSAQTLAALAILDYTAKLAAGYDTKLFVSINKPNVFPVADEIVRSAYIQKGKADRYNPNLIQFQSEEQFAFASATVGIVNREHAASVILVGYFEAEAVVLAEAAGQAEAITIGGCGSVTQVPYFAVVCDYCLIGEELMIADAYLNKETSALGTVAGQDWIKMLLIALVLIGAMAVTVGDKFFTSLFKF